MPYIAEEKEPDEPLYPAYLPHPIKTPAPLSPEFEHHDPALRADPSFPNLFPPTATHRKVTPFFGTEIEDVQLTALSPEGLDELGLLVAQRGFAVFRKQDWKDAGFEKQLAIGRHFGPLHQHATAARPEGQPEINVIYDSAADVRRKNFWGERVSGINWHIDQSHEKQPPTVTFFGVLENQDWCGGDTLMADTVQAYEHLSVPIQQFLLGLDALHTENVRAAKPTNQNLYTIHPVVTKHPVTGAKSLFVNEVFTKRIEGLKVEESEYLLKFLFDHIARGADFSARVKWEEGTVVIWDQRRAQHTATLDTPPGKRRHMIRITPLGGKPLAARG